MQKKVGAGKKCWQWVSSSFPRSDDSLFLVFDNVIVFVDVVVHVVANAKILVKLIQYRFAAGVPSINLILKVDKLSRKMFLFLYVELEYVWK